MYQHHKQKRGGGGQVCKQKTRKNRLEAPVTTKKKYKIKKLQLQIHKQQNMHVSVHLTII